MILLNQYRELASQNVTSHIQLMIPLKSNNLVISQNNVISLIRNSDSTKKRNKQVISHFRHSVISLQIIRNQIEQKNENNYIESLILLRNVTE